METKYVQIQPHSKKPRSQDQAAAQDTAAMKEAVISALHGIFDPEIPVNIVDLGLIYELHVADNGEVDVKMTLTAPACPVAETMPGQVEKVVRNVSGVTGTRVELVWDPPWTQDRMSEAARLELGLL